jgi:hypothetical protein
MESAPDMLVRGQAWSKVPIRLFWGGRMGWTTFISEEFTGLDTR